MNSGIFVKQYKPILPLSGVKVLYFLIAPDNMATFSPKHVVSRGLLMMSCYVY